MKTARFPQCVPIKSSHNAIDSLSESMDRWRANHIKNAAEDKARQQNKETEVEEEMAAVAQNTSQEGVKFTLRTEAGELSFSQSQDGSYTDFLRVALEMLLAFNGTDIDSDFKRIMQRALLAYENGEDLDVDEERDFLQDAIQNQIAFNEAQNQSTKFEEASKYAVKLPASDSYALRILSFDEDDKQRLVDMILKHTDLLPNFIQDAIQNGKSFVVPAEKAKELYIQLRMFDVILTIKVPDKSPPKKTTAKTSKSKNNEDDLSTKTLSVEDGIIG